MVHWLTFVYATTDKQKRVQQWEFLATARQNWGDNWWLGGDFNDITGDRDKRGGTQRTTNSFNDFRLFISIMEMVECNFIGYAYTWNNLRRDADFVEERLDRVFVSPSWEMNYPNHQVLHIFMHASDHMLLMYKEEDGDQRSKDKSHRFNFDKRWTSKAGFSDCVEQAWSFTTSGKPLTQLSRKLKVCKENLKKWNNASKNNSALIIKDLSTQLENLHTKGGQRDWDNWGEIKQKLWEANRDEEVFWQQKSRLLWLKEGDKNTNFFHASTLQRRKRNSLFTLLDENGNVCANDDKISERVSDHFDNLFSTVWEGSDFGLLEGMPCTISAAQNTTIMKKVDEKEIKTALFELSPDKAPGIGYIQWLTSSTLGFGLHGCFGMVRFFRFKRQQFLSLWLGNYYGFSFVLWGFSDSCCTFIYLGLVILLLFFVWLLRLPLFYIFCCSNFICF